MKFHVPLHDCACRGQDGGIDIMECCRYGKKITAKRSVRPKNDGELTIRELLTNGLDKKSLYKAIKSRKIHPRCPRCGSLRGKIYSKINSDVWAATIVKDLAIFLICLSGSKISKKRHNYAMFKHASHKATSRRSIFFPSFSSLPLDILRE